MKKICTTLAAAVLFVGCGGSTSTPPSIDRGKPTAPPVESVPPTKDGKPGAGGPEKNMKPA